MNVEAVRAFFISALVLLAAMAAPANPVATASNVAVIDFTVQADDTNRWAWAKSGTADLLEMELAKQGVTTLDRDFIHAVFQEQRLAETGLTKKDCLTVASLLNASLLVTGTITPLQNGRVRVAANVFSVEAIETVVTASDEGAFPRELPQIMMNLARTLGAKIQTTGMNETGSATPEFAPKPEALILFYRGLNACAAGHPEFGAAWFANAAELDPEFTAPLLWEIKTYELMRLDDLAAIRREEVATTLHRLGVETVAAPATNKPAAKPVVAVLDAVISSPDISLHPAAQRLTEAIKQSLLTTAKVRLFAFENIGDAVAEHDLQLSSLFRRQGAPRYGRWLMADALLLSRVKDHGEGQVAIELTLVNPLTAGRTAQIELTGPAREIEPLVSHAANELMDDWASHKPTNSVAAVLESPVTVEAAAANLEMRPVYQNLALALAQVRQESAKSDTYRALANAFNGINRWPAAALEITHCLEALDGNAPDADLVFFGTHRWLHSEGGGGWLGASLKLVSPKAEEQMIEKLLVKFPHSIAAGCMYYDLARDDWGAQHWEAVCDRAGRAIKILETTLPAGLLWGGGAHRNILGAAYYLEGYSLVELGQSDAARAVFQRGGELLKDHFLRETTPGSFLVPYGPAVAILNGKREISGFGGDRFVIPPEVAKQLALAGATVNLREAAEEIFNATEKSGAWTNGLQTIADLLGQVPDNDDPMFQGVLAVGNKSLSEARIHLSPVRLRSLVELLAGKVFARGQIKSFAATETIPQARVVDAAVAVLSIYESAGLKEEGWMKIKPLLTDPFSAETGLALLTRLDWDLENYTNQLQRLISRLPGGEADVSAPVWSRLGEIYFGRENYRLALDNYCKAISKGADPWQCPGLSRALVENALMNHHNSSAEAGQFCRACGIKGFEPYWFDWFNAGQKFQKAHDGEKAVACYQNVLEFLDHPEKSGRYRLKKDDYNKVFLQWGDGFDKLDLRWADLYDQRWNSAAFCLAQCLVETGSQEEAAQWLRRIALSVGGDNFDLLENVTWNSSRSRQEKIGVRAAEMLKQLHLQSQASP